MATRKKPNKTSKPVSTKAVEEPKKSKITFKRAVIQLFAWLLTIAVLYWVFAIKLAGEISFSEVWATVSALSVPDIIFLLAAGLLTIVAVGWTAATVLPGLSVAKGTEASVVGQLTSVALPPPIDMVIRFAMYRTYGFSVDKSAVAVVVAGIARYFTVVAIPLLGLFLVLITGQGDTDSLLWFIGGTIVFFIALWIMKMILSSEAFARKIGGWLAVIANKVRSWFHKKPVGELADQVADFGVRTKDVAIGNFKPITISNIAWGLSCFLVMLLAIRFCGIDSSVYSFSEILLITGGMLLFSSIPITPGGIGVSEALLLSIMTFPSEEIQAAFLSALFVYRIFTWLLPMPIGALAYFHWRRQSKQQKLQPSKA